MRECGVETDDDDDDVAMAEDKFKTHHIRNLLEAEHSLKRFKS